MEFYGFKVSAQGEWSNVSTSVPEYDPINLDGWSQLEDETGVKAYFGDAELALFVQRVVDPSRWRYLNHVDIARLENALAVARGEAVKTLYGVGED